MEFLSNLFPAHFNKIKKVVFILALCFSIGALIVLLRVIPKNEISKTVGLGTIQGQDQEVTRKSSESLSFSQINKGDQIYDGDNIFTGDKSGTTIVFTKSKNILKIPKKGLVKIELAATDNRGETVQVLSGLAEFVIQKNQSINFVKGEEKIKLSADANGEGAGKVFFDNDKLILQVDEGQVKVNNSKGIEQVIKKDEAASLGENTITKIQIINIVKPESNEKIDISKGINVSWDYEGEVEILLSKNKDFTEAPVIVKAQKSPYHFQLPLIYGEYFLKIRGTITNGPISSIIPIEMFQPFMIDKLSPENNSTVSPFAGQAITLSWKDVHADKYKVTTKNNQEQTLVFYTVKPSLNLPGLKGTSFEWSVSAMAKSGDYQEESVKNLVKINFKGANKILSPSPDQNISLDKKVLLSWEAVAEEKKKIIISDLTSKEILFQDDLKSRQYEFTPKGPGLYKIELSSLDYPTLAKASVQFLVTAKVANWTSKEIPAIASTNEEENKFEIKFKEFNKNIKDLILDVYSDTGLKILLSSTAISSSTINYSMNKFGTKCLVIRSKVNPTFWLPGLPFCLKYNELASFKNLAIPKVVILKYIKVNGVDAYSIELPLIPTAENYEIQVFSDSKGGNVVFFEKSKSRIITWPTVRDGAYYYRYRVSDSEGRLSNYSKIAKLFFPISPFEDFGE